MSKALSTEVQPSNTMDSKNDAALREFQARTKQAQGQYPKLKKVETGAQDFGAGLDTAYLTRVGQSPLTSKTTTSNRRRQLDMTARESA